MALQACEELGYIPQRLGLIAMHRLPQCIDRLPCKILRPLDIFASKQAKEWAKKAIAKMGLEHKTWNPSNVYPGVNKGGSLQLEHSLKDQD